MNSYHTNISTEKNSFPSDLCLRDNKLINEGESLVQKVSVIRYLVLFNRFWGSNLKSVKRFDF